MPRRACGGPLRDLPVGGVRGRAAQRPARGLGGRGRYVRVMTFDGLSIVIAMGSLAGNVSRSAASSAYRHGPPRIHSKGGLPCASRGLCAATKPPFRGIVTTSTADGERLSSRMLARRDRPDGFIEPCIPTLAAKPSAGPDGCMRSSTTAIG